MSGIMFRKTLRDLRRRLPQFAAITVTVLAGVLLFVAGYDSYRNLSSSYDRTYERLRFADLTADGGSPDRSADAVRGAPGVAAVTTRTQADRPLRIGGDKLIGRVAGLPAGAQPAVNRVEVASGRGLSPSAPDGVLVEKHAADTFGLSPGDRLRAFDGTRWRSLTVRGVAVSPEYLWPARDRQEVLADPHSFAVLFAPEATARALAGPDAAAQTLARMTDRARGGGAEREAAAALRKAGAAHVTERAEQASNATLHEDLKGFEQLALGFPVLFLAAAGVAAYVLITRLVLAERKVIATFLAAGAPRDKVVRHYLGHGLLAGTAGGVLGVLLGMLATSGMTHAYTAALKIPDTVVTTRPPVLLAGLLFGVAVGLLSGLAPALAASRAAPAEAMRGDGGRLRPPGPWSRAVGRARALPLTGRLALRELTRSRRRTLATMTGTVLALVVVLASVGMLTSMRSMMNVQFDDVQRQDATVTAGPAAGDLTARLRATPRVADVERVTKAQVTVSSRGRSYATSLGGYERGTAMHGFRADGGGDARLPAHGVLAGKALADRLRVSVGDTVTVHAPDGRTARTRLAGLLDEPLGTAVYSTRDTARTLTGAAGNAYELRFAPGTGEAERDRARARISGVDGVVAYADTQALRHQFDELLSLFWVFVGAMLALGAVLALTVVYVTMTVNVAERTSELATLRAAGVSLRRIDALLAVENLTATLLAIPLGLAAGWAAASVSLRSFNSDMFTLDLDLGPTTLLAASAAMLAASLLSQLPAIRVVRSLDIARVVRERAQ
ncbi:ABC transporter permease [Streptomyces boncukensis]|uniref:FtsX-like permease family protein n=1 Tax=Streptomyces boncukensis TaxID=2711219 RepID=A0A6G4X2H0_9ACTN|nr:FtsX-like permease family protein [Streptomyces boncukensis]NGO71080.1 FtsX-like permease family protein [Streptomyces boncukensis]